MLCNNLDDISEAVNKSSQKHQVQPPSSAPGPAPELPSDVSSSDLDSCDLDSGGDLGLNSPGPSLPDPKRLKTDDEKPIAKSFGLLHNAVVKGNISLKKQLITEVFSPPRVTMAARAQGYSADYAFDLTYNDWNGLNPTMRSELRELLFRMKPTLLVLSPPCTMFSALTRLGSCGHPWLPSQKVSLMHIIIMMMSLSFKKISC